MTDAWGITDGYHDVAGVWHPTTDETRRRLRDAIGNPVPPGEAMWFVPQGTARALNEPGELVLEDGTTISGATSLPPELAPGYHRFIPRTGAAVSVVVHPVCCPRPAREWGMAVQVPSLWSATSWGIGDLGDVATTYDAVVAHGGGLVLMSPLHAPAPTLPQHSSPYFPSSRRFVSPLLVPMPGAPPGMFRKGLVNRDRSWTTKRGALERRFLAGRDAPEWRAWAAAEGDELARYATWCALADRFGSSWPEWPAAYQHPSSPAVTALAGDASWADAVAFHTWCQFVAHRELHRVAGTRRLMADMAVGFAPDGADAWEFQDELALDVRLGAPPDALGPEGQDWGLPPFAPARLRAGGYRPFISTLRAVMRHMAGVRIDHVMGLFRQFWIPTGAPSRDGAYVQFPAHELLALLCLEATRAGAFVVGEDLGTVQPEVREALAGHRILGTKVVWFEPAPPSEWPEMCLATATTHDLPTITGVAGATDGADLSGALDMVIGEGPHRPADAVRALHARLLASPAAVRLVTAEDVCHEAERPNVPGTIDEVNWNRRLPVPVDDLPEALDRAVPTS